MTDGNVHLAAWLHLHGHLNSKKQKVQRLMAERRSLIDGLNAPAASVDRTVEKTFVFVKRGRKRLRRSSVRLSQESISSTSRNRTSKPSAGSTDILVMIGRLSNATFSQESKRPLFWQFPEHLPNALDEAIAANHIFGINLNAHYTKPYEKPGIFRDAHNTRRKQHAMFSSRVKTWSSIFHRFPEKIQAALDSLSPETVIYCA